MPASVRSTSSAGAIVRYAESVLPTEWGQWRVVVYQDGDDEHLALVFGELGAQALCRVHSECLTGEVFGSLRCDCRPQLEAAMSSIAANGSGVIVYLRQEGRGIGLGNKIRAYSLQDNGADTVRANEQLGFAADARQYQVAGSILNELGVRSVRLMTNNPEKIEGLREHGIEVLERLAHWVDSGKHNHEYLETKRSEMGHLRDDEDKPS